MGKEEEKKKMISRGEKYTKSEKEESWKSFKMQEDFSRALQFESQKNNSNFFVEHNRKNECMLYNTSCTIRSYLDKKQ